MMGLFVCRVLCSATVNKCTRVALGAFETQQCIFLLSEPPGLSQNISDRWKSWLKWKEICSSFEILHLIDIVSDHISPDKKFN